MELQKLTYFLAAAQTQNFNRAAELCSVAQPVLSRQIAALEAELGVELFKRHKKRVSLTPAGQEFAEHIKAAFVNLRAGQQAMSQVKAGERGLIVIGCVEPLVMHYLPAYLTHFRQQYPAIRVQLNLGGPDEILKAVEQGEYDLGLVGLPAREARSTALLIMRQLYRDQLHLVTRPDHPLARREFQHQPITLAEALAEPLVILKEGFWVRRVLEEVSTAQNLSLRPVLELDLIEGIKAFVKEGAGVSFLLRSVVKPDEGLAVIPVSDLTEEFSFVVVYRRIEPLSQAAATLLNALVNPEPGNLAP